MRNKVNVMIICRSPNKEDLIAPHRKISNLFTSKLLKIAESEFRFLGKID